MPTVSRILQALSIVVCIIAATLTFLWLSEHNFGMRQSVEFFPYDDTVTLTDGSTIRSSGVVIIINDRDSFPSDRDMAVLMLAARESYPSECSGENWEISVRRPLPGGMEERYSYTFSLLSAPSPVSRIEYGRWLEGTYTVIDSYDADWSEVEKVARGETEGFAVEVG